MQRREVLAGVAGLLGSALAGCVGDLTGDDSAGDYRWRHDTVGSVETVADGLVLGREDFAEADGGVFALDAETGDHRWTYGETGGYTSYSELAVDDAVYFGLGDDAIGSGSGELYAVEFDGTERWARSAGSVYSRPHLADGAVYAAGDDQVIRAFETDDGEPLWTAELEAETPESPRIVDVSSFVTVRSVGLVTLDADDGSVRWRYDEREVSDAFVDDAVYAATDEGLTALEADDGEQLWETALPGPKAFVGREAGRLVVNRDDGLAGFDADGDERWTFDAVESPADRRGRLYATLRDGVVYVGGSRVQAVDVESGDRLWRTELDDEPVGSLSVVDGERAGVADDHAVFVHVGGTIYRLNPDGEITWTDGLDEDIDGYAVDGSIFVGGDTIYALELPQPAER